MVGASELPSQEREAWPSGSRSHVVIFLDLLTGISTSLDAKLDRALDALDDLNANNDVAAIISLNAFINAVMGQSGNAIPVEDADFLIEQAFAILTLL